MEVDDQSPYYYTVYAFDGRLFHLNRDMISRDESHPIPFDLSAWWGCPSKLTAKHSNWCAGAIVQQTYPGICPRDIIVLEYTMNGLTHRNWFLRSIFKWTKRGGAAIRNVIEHLSYPSEERIASQTKRSRDQLEVPVFTTGPLGWAP